MNEQNTPSPKHHPDLCYIGTWNSNDPSTKAATQNNNVTPIKMPKHSTASNEEISSSRSQQYLVDSCNNPESKYQQCTLMQRWLAQGADDEPWSAISIFIEDFPAQKENTLVRETAVLLQPHAQDGEDFVTN